MHVRYKRRDSYSSGNACASRRSPDCSLQLLTLLVFFPASIRRELMQEMPRDHMLFDSS